MSDFLKELIEKRDAELSQRQAFNKKLYEQVRSFFQDIREWTMRNEWRMENNTPLVSFLWLGMRFWPKLLNESHSQYVKGFYQMYMATLSMEQAEALRLSVFEGMARGSVKANWSYEWSFEYREDGWVELLIGIN